MGLRKLSTSLVFLLIAVSLPLQAQNASNRPTFSIWESDFPSVFFFPIDKHLLLRDYRTNSTMFASLDEALADRQIVENIVAIEIIGACSPPGNNEYNRELAYNRCLAMRSYLRWKHLPVAERFPISLNVIGVDYVGYRILKQKNPQLSEKEVWNMLQYAAIRLKMNDGSYVAPGQKQTEITSSWRRDPEPARDTIIIYQTRESSAVTEEAPKKQLTFALKTNLLYDIALLPNLTAEVYLGGDVSLAVEANWSWWSFGQSTPNQWFHRIQAAGVELRYWMRSPHPLQGHAIGIYSLIGNYDVRLFPKDETSIGWLSRLSWSAGLSYAYSMPIASKLNLEFGLALGYVGGDYYKYGYCLIHEQWEWGRNPNPTIYKRGYWGPTRAGISLVWVLGKGNSKYKEKQAWWENINTHYSY